MPELTDNPFSSFDPEVPVPLTASEIRHRGDLRRRRNTGLAVAGAVAAVALIVAPIAVLGGGTDRAELPVATQTPTVSDPSPSTTTASGSPEAPPPTEDVSDFALAQGWPADSEAEPGAGFGLTGPSTSIDPFDYSVCSTPLPLDDVRGSLRATWSNVEDSRTRELLTFADAQQAVAFMDRAGDFYTGCPREVGSDGYTSVHEVLPTTVGGQSFAAVNTWHFDGAPAIGLEVLHFIRLGRAVVIDTTSGEGMRAGAPGVIDEMSGATAQVVADLCRFTDADC